MEISKLKSQGLLITGKTGSIALDPAVKDTNVSADSADFAIISEGALEFEKFSDEKRIFSHPGEFEVNGIAVHAFPVDEVTAKAVPPLLFVIYVDQMKVCYLPALRKELHSDLIEKIGDVDLLIFPNSGEEKVWQPTIEEIEPKSLLPLEVEGGNLSIDSILSKIGLTSTEAKDKISIKTKADLRSDQMAVYRLS